MHEVKNEISKLNVKKAPGFDKVDALVLKSLPESGLKFLTILFNRIIGLTHFPTQWKCAEIILVPKPNKPEHMISSYRPISLISTFSKVFERLLLCRILPILETKNIIPEYQFGFRHKHGTPEQCHRIVKEIALSLESKKYCCGVFLDIKQAFDKVWHEGLLYKLKKCLPAPYYMILRSYLHNRNFYVKFNTDYSKIYHIRSGVPQGSVIGPVLYTVYTSDMPVLNNVTIATYADDTALLSANESPIEASKIIQNALNKVETWLNTWNIQVNNDKSVQITFTLRRGECPPVYFYGSPLPQKTSVRYLGLKIDKRLTWKDHVKDKRQQLDKKTKRMFWLLGPKSELRLENKLVLYKTVLKPIWTYGIQLWGTTSNSNIEILQRYQAKTFRLITNAPWFMNNKNLHKDLKMSTIKEEINKFSVKYLNRLSNHTNVLAITLLDDTDELRRLKRIHILDLPYR